jgi:hypothetical protein
MRWGGERKDYPRKYNPIKDGNDGVCLHLPHLDGGLESRGTPLKTRGSP